MSSLPAERNRRGSSAAAAAAFTAILFVFFTDLHGCLGLLTAIMPGEITGVLLSLLFAAAGLSGILILLAIPGFLVGQKISGQAADAPRRTWISGIGLAVLPSIAAIMVINDLFSGRWISSRSWSGAVRIVLMAATIALLLRLACFTLAHVRRMRDQPNTNDRTRHRRLGWVLVTFIPCLLILNDRLFPGQYPTFHSALLILAAVAAAIIGSGWAPNITRTRNVAWAVLILCAVGALGLLSGRLPGDNPIRRQALLEEATITSRILGYFLAPSEATVLPVNARVARELDNSRIHDPELLDAVFPGRRQWNLVILTLDTVRPDHVGAYGYGKNTTPALDRFAGESVVFENAYAQHPSTHLSMSSFLEGRYPTGTSWHHSREGTVKVEPFSTFPEHFRKHGHDTLAYTSFDPELTRDLGDVLSRGFARFNDIPLQIENTAEYTSDRVLDSLEKTPTDRPFLLWAHFFDPHEPYVEHPESPGFGDDRAALYDGEIWYADHHAGRILDALRARDDWDRTVVVMNSDHGEELGERGGWSHNSSLHEEQVRILLMLRLPGGTHRRINRNVELVDLPATFFELFGLGTQDKIHGHSLLPLAWPTGGPRPLHQPPDVAFMQLRVPRIGFQDSVRVDRRKLIQNLGTGTWRTYDLGTDPGELNNLSLAGGELDRDLAAYLNGCRALARDRLDSGERHDDVAEGLLEASRNGPVSARLSATELLILHRKSTAALAAIQDLLADEDPATVRRTLELVLRHGVSVNTEVTRSLFTHRDAVVRREAMRAWSPDPGNREPLRRMARGDDPSLSTPAILALGLQGDPGVQGPLKRLSDTATGIDRILAGCALSRAGDPRHHNLTRRLLGQSSLPGNIEAVAIRSLKPSDPIDLLSLYSRMLARSLYTERDEALIDATVARDPGFSAPLLRILLTAPLPSARQRAQALLERSHKADWIPVLEDVEAKRRLVSRSLTAFKDLEAAMDSGAQAWSRGIAGGIVDWGVAFELMHHLLKRDRREEAHSLMLRLHSEIPANLDASARELMGRLAAVSKTGDEPPQLSLTLVRADPLAPTGEPWTGTFLVQHKGGRPIPGGDAFTTARFGWRLTQGTDRTIDSIPFPFAGLLPGESMEVPLVLPPLPSTTQKATLSLAIVDAKGPIVEPITIRQQD